MTPELIAQIKAEAAVRVERSRKAQGLPRHIEDPTLIAMTVNIIRGVWEQRKQTAA